MTVESDRKERRERDIITTIRRTTITITITTIIIIEKPSCIPHKANTKQQRHFAR